MQLTAIMEFLFLLLDIILIDLWYISKISSFDTWFKRTRQCDLKKKLEKNKISKYRESNDKNSIFEGRYVNVKFFIGSLIHKSNKSKEAPLIDGFSKTARY